MMPTPLPERNPDIGPAKPSYRPELDGVRAFCILFTIINHVPGHPWYLNGTMGVDAFFALSGWLITWLLLREQKRNGSIDLKAFYIRRAFRIVPLYMLVFLIYIVIIAVTHNPVKAQEMSLAAPYLATFNSEYRPVEAGVVFGHAWTLGIEEKFYIIWPALMLLAGRSRSLAIIGGLVAAFALIVLARDTSLLIRGYFGLAFGTGLALVMHSSAAARALIERRRLAKWPILALAVIYALSITIWRDHYWPNILVSIASGLLIVSLWFNRDQRPARVLASRPLAYAGRLTYGIYLIQTLAIAIGGAALKAIGLGSHWLTILLTAYLGSIVAAAILHRLIERPLQTLGRRLASARRDARPAGITPHPGDIASE